MLSPETAVDRIAMQDNAALTESDEGKDVVNSDGHQIGRVMSVQGGEVHVDPDPGLTDTIRSKLGLDDEDADEYYALDPSSIESVSDDEIHLTR